MFGQVVIARKCTDISKLKNVIGLEQFYSLLYGELKYLVQEKKPSDVRQTAQIANFVSQIRGPVHFEGKYMRKTWDPKYSKGLVQSPPKMGGHFVEKPSEQGQPKKQFLEGKEKLERFAGKSSWGEKICFACQGRGHIASQCFNTKQNKENSPQKVNVKETKAVYCIQNSQMTPSRDSSVTMETKAEAAKSSEIDTLREQISSDDESLPIAEIRHCLYIKADSSLFESAGDNIKIFENNYLALRDTCSQVTICHSDIVPQNCLVPNQQLTLKGIGKEVVILPVAEVLVDYQGWRGNWRVGVSSQIPTPVLIGTDLSKHVKSALVITRSKTEQIKVAGNGTECQEKEEIIPQAEAFSLEIPQKNIFVREQTLDPTLKTCFDKVEDKELSPECPERFIIKRGLLYKEKLINITKGGPEVKSLLVVPDKYHPMILEKGHADIFATHLGINKTKQRISQNFYWPDMGKQVRSFCQRCDVCQRQGHNQDKTKAKLCPLPVISTPFTR